MAKTKYIRNKIEVKLNTETGEMRETRIKLEVHQEDFFCAYLSHWGDFGVREGMKLRVFVQCILVSKPSVFGQKEGNVFHLRDAVEAAVLNIDGMTENCARQHIKRLIDGGFVIKTEKRGRYYINPKYGIKGAISERSYFHMITVAKGKDDGILRFDDLEYVK